jgi:hypothetical protein
MNKIFEEDDLPQEPENYYNELVGENRKFKDQEALAKGKWYADRALSTKERQFDELSSDYLRLKADYDARAKLEELLKDRLQQPQERDETPQNANQPGYNPDDLKKLMKQELTSYEREKRYEENVKKSKEIARESLGTNWSSTLKSKMDDLDITEEETYSLMERNPKVFASTFGLQTKPGQPSFQSPPTSNQRSDVFKPSVNKAAAGRTWSYYQKLKEEKGLQEWLDPKIQAQMYKDSQELGDAFADGDFGAINPALVRGI